MKVTTFDIKGIALLEPTVYRDERGYFFESFNQSKFENALSIKPVFVQDNQSKSQKNVIRGLHFQAPPFGQGKLVTVIQGSVLDVVVDIRKESKTYGKHVSVKLEGETGKMFWIPEGFAHGFKTLEDNTIFTYKCTNFYNRSSEGSVLWNDKNLGINWNIETNGNTNFIISEKDKIADSFSTFVSPF